MQSSSRIEEHRQAAIRVNNLAGDIHSLADARKYVNDIAEMFADSVPARWAQDAILDRVAHAEYKAVEDFSYRIAEQHIADVWNAYAQEIGAPEEAMVTAAEIYNMREATRAACQLMWTTGNQTIWTAPQLYAVTPDGNLAQGCRAIEALRILHDIGNIFDNVLAARKRLQEHISTASWRGSLDRVTVSCSVRLRVTTDLMRASETRYIHAHGTDAYYALIDRMVNTLFPSQ